MAKARTYLGSSGRRHSRVAEPSVVAQLKRRAVKSQETCRNTPVDDAIVDERTLHEMCLPHMETAVEQGEPSSAVCAYSRGNRSGICSKRSCSPSSRGSGSSWLHRLRLAGHPLHGRLRVQRPGHRDARRPQEQRRRRRGGCQDRRRRQRVGHPFPPGHASSSPPPRRTGGGGSAGVCLVCRRGKRGCAGRSGSAHQRTFDYGNVSARSRFDQGVNQLL